MMFVVFVLAIVGLVIPIGLLLASALVDIAVAVWLACDVCADRCRPTLIHYGRAIHLLH